MTPILAADPAAVAKAAAILTAGGLVAFPTETVYGLGARGLHADEVRKIFQAKRRPAGHPVILHVDGEAMARGLAAEWSAVASELVRRFWPGPLTLVVPRASHVPGEVSGGLDTVGIRAPSHPAALALIRAVGQPIAAPSANLHTAISPTTAQHVANADWRGLVELVLDGGTCDVGIESTVVALGPRLRVLRPGAITITQLREVDPNVVDGATVIEGDEARPAPGMASRHYAPMAYETRLIPRGSTFPKVSGSAAAIVVTNAMQRAAAASRSLSALIVLPDDPVHYAHDLYDALRKADEAASDLIVVEAPPANDPAWAAVADRLKRAAHR